MKFKSGFVTIIGRPNVGKSTLLNNIIGEKLSIISDKPQTTRNKIQCIHTDESCQIVFLDTPGIHKPKNKLGNYMMDAVKSAFDGVDLILWLIDESKELGAGDKYILEELKKIKTKKILVINKMDKLNKAQLVKMAETYDAFEIFEDIVPISALKDINVNRLLNRIKKNLPEGPQYFPEDMITDQPERFIAGEIIREKALHYLDQEIPHGIAVEIEKMKPRNNKEIVDVSATIYCERDSHKGIIIGKNGRKLKGIGKSARMEIERLLGSKIYLELWVKVKKNWRDKENLVKQMGYKRV